MSRAGLSSCIDVDVDVDETVTVRVRVRDGDTDERVANGPDPLFLFLRESTRRDAKKRKSSPSTSLTHSHSSSTFPDRPRSGKLEQQGRAGKTKRVVQAKRSTCLLALGLCSRPHALCSGSPPSLPRPLPLPLPRLSLCLTLTLTLTLCPTTTPHPDSPPPADWFSAGRTLQSLHSNQYHTLIQPHTHAHIHTLTTFQTTNTSTSPSTPPAGQEDLNKVDPSLISGRQEGPPPKTHTRFTHPPLRYKTNHHQPRPRPTTSRHAQPRLHTAQAPWSSRRPRQAPAYPVDR